MERPPLSFAEVLDEELLFLRRRAGPRAAGDGKTLPSGDWQFRCEDFRELLVLNERLAQKKPPVRYRLLKATPGDDHCARFNALASNRKLLKKLLRDETFAGNLMKRTDIVRRILAVGELRRILLAHKGTVGKLLARDMLRVTVAGGDEVANLLDEPDVQAAVHAQPQLLGSIIASPDLRDALTEKAHRRNLAVIAGVAKKGGFFRKAGNAVKTTFLKLIGRRPVDPSPPRAGQQFDFGDPSHVLVGLKIAKKEAAVAAR